MNHTGLIAGAALVVGLLGGYFLGRAATPEAGPAAAGGVNAPAPAAAPGSTSTPSGLSEQTGLLRHVNNVGSFEAFYPQPFASPPALEILDDHPLNQGWGYRLVEQRADGFKLEISSGGGVLNDKPLRYVAKGTPHVGVLIYQEGEAQVPTGSPGLLEVYYRTPFPSPPHLTFPKGLSFCTVTEQKATGFKLLRNESSGLSYLPVKWRAEHVAGK